MFDSSNPETYTHQRMQFRWRFWFPVLVIVIVAGVGSYALMQQNGTMGFALFLCVPFSVGCALGYGTRVSVWLTILLSLLATSCMVFLLLAMNLSGIFCGLTLGLIFLFPALIGCFVGWAARMAMTEASWDRRRFIFMGLFLGLPFGAEQVESRWPMAPSLSR